MAWKDAQDTAPQDLRPLDFKTLTWHFDDVAGSLERVADAVTAEAVRAIDWYLEAKRSKKRGARWLRVIAILFSTGAALFPIVIEIFENEIVWDGKRLWWASPAWSSVLLIGAFALVLLDRFYGFSSAWMRYLSADFQIRETLHAFRMDWQIERAGWKNGKPTEQQIQEGLRACRAFLAQVDAILKSELDAWVQEFRSALKDIDEAVKAYAETTKATGANITVENGEQCSQGWTLVVDSGQPQLHHGRTAALADLVPGMRTVRVTGEIGGKTVSVAKTFAAVAGSVAEVSLRLD